MLHNRSVQWQTRSLGTVSDVLAPDGSQIRPLVEVEGGSMVHCSLPAGQVTRAVRHRTVAEVWYCLAGGGQVWRRQADVEEVVDLAPGVALSIPVGVAFQFRADGPRPLELVITTLPPWPGAEEALPVEGAWEAAR